MNSAARYVIAALVIAIAAHFAIIHAIPRLLMGAAFDRLSAHGAPANTWRRAERVTEASRSIVRPSPDLQYSACPYDLATGPLVIRVAAWPHYWSLSLYAANSDNYFVLDDREAHDGAQIVLVRAGQAPPEDAAKNGLRVVTSPTQRGVALVRRLAPSASEFDAAVAASRNDACTLLH